MCVFRHEEAVSRMQAAQASADRRLGGGQKAAKAVKPLTGAAGAAGLKG